MIFSLIQRSLLTRLVGLPISLLYYSQAQAQCPPQQEAKLIQIESQLLQDPNNRILQIAYKLITQACQHNSISQTQWHAQAAFAYGKNTNPLRTSSADYFTLTLPETPLKLTNPTKPRAQTYHQLQIAIQAHSPKFSLQFQAQQTQWHTVDLKNETQWQLTLQPQPIQQPIQPQLYLSQVQVQTQIQTTFGLQLRHPFQITNWEGQVGFLTQQYQDVRYNQNLLQAQCLYHLANQQFVLALQQAQPTQGDQSRAGGIQNSLLVSWLRTWSLPTSWQLQTQLTYQYTQDTQGYSPYLKNNEKRNTQLKKLQVTLTRPLTRQIVLQMYTQIIQQQSNLPIFQWSQQQAALQLMMKF